MRPHAAPVRGIADHHIVDAPVGDEAKGFYEGRDVGHMMIHRLHQQRPRFVSEFPKARLRQGAAFHLQLISLTRDQA